MADFKTGRLSVEEQESIKKYKNDKSVGEIAKLLGRRPQAIKTFLQKLPSIEAKENVNGIEGTPLWKDLQRQLDNDELDLFKEEYIRYVEQFKNDVLYTETVQISDAIKLGILGNRCLSQTKVINASIRSLDDAVSAVIDSGGEMTPEIMEKEQQRMALMATFETLSKEYQSYMKLKDKALIGLKATRDQRYAKIESARTSFVNWMQNIIEDDNINRDTGIYIEKNRLAMEKEQRRLGQPHQYEDGEYDIPFLNEDTVMQDYEELNETGAKDENIAEEVAG